MLTPHGSSNTNTVPTAIWAVMEAMRDPELFAALRAEVLTTYSPDSVTGAPVLDVQKMLTLPLLQSVFTETLRVHMCMNISRDIIMPIKIEGFTLPAGSWLQAPTEISHMDEAIWAREGHPASEFWAARHVRYVETKKADGSIEHVPQFAMAGRPNDWFPFGR